MSITHKESFMKYVFGSCAALCIVCVALICWFLVSGGLPAILEIGPANFLFSPVWKPSQNEYGILSMIAGTFCLGAGAILLGGVLGILCALYLVYYCPKRLYGPFKSGIGLLAGIPSIVYGFFGLVVLVPLLMKIFPGTSGKGILCASILLGIMILPTVVSVSESALQKVDRSYYEASLAVGASHERSVFLVCLPAARSGIIASIVLGLGRAIGETMAVVMVAGNAALFPDSLLSPVRTLTSNIVLEMSYASGLHRQALIATALVLFVLIMAINFCFALAKKKEAS